MSRREAQKQETSTRRRVQDSIPRGRMEAARSGGGLSSTAKDRYQNLNTPEAQAAFADKWVRLTAYQMDGMWVQFYEFLVMIRDQKLYANPMYMEGGETCETFEDYWVKALQQPFDTWTRLEKIYHFVKENAPELFDGSYSAAVKAVQDRAERVPPTKSNSGPEPGSMVKGKRAPIADGIRNKCIGGDDLDYLTGQIAKRRPDILDRMKAGEFKSVRAAALEAGIIKPMVKIPLDPIRASRLLRKHFQGEALDALIKLLQES